MMVAIVGGSQSWKDAPFSDMSWEIWALGNQLDRYAGRVPDLVFEIHDDLSEHDPIYPQWLVDTGIPLVVGPKFPIKCDHAIEFDYKEAASLIGENFSSSPSVMMAHAIMHGATEIGIWGVDMALDEHEYFMQRPSMEQWIGYAKGRGIKVYIHESSPLGYTTYREGRDWPDKGFTGHDEGELLDMAKLHKAEAEKAEKELQGLMAAQQRIEELKARYQGHDGARQAYERLAKVERAKSSGIDVDLRQING